MIQTQNTNLTRLETPKHCQEGVKKIPSINNVTLDINITKEMLLELRRELQQSLAEFGLTLKRASDPNAKTGYSRQYISRLEHGKDIVTPELSAAFYNIAAAMDEVPAGIGGAVTVSLLAQPGQMVDGAFIPRSATTARCKRPGCNVVFIKTHPRQEFHDPDCRRQWTRSKNA